MYQIIVNPASCSGKSLRIWREQVEPALLNEQIEYTVHFSEKAGDVARIAAELTSPSEGELNAADFRDPQRMIILGGDGTMNEFLQGIADTSRIILGYVPTGSSNDLARDLGIPKNPREALDLILHTGTPCRMDMGEVTFDSGERRRFAVSCGIGFDAAVCAEANRSKIKNGFNRIGLGKLTYLGIALKQLFTAKAVSCRLSMDGNAPVSIHRILFIAGMLHRYEGGGFMFCPDATGCEGRFHLCAVGDISKGLILWALPTAFSGKHYRYDGITPYTAQSYRIETSEPLWVHTDGEAFRKADALTVVCKKDSLLIIRP